MVRYKPLAHQLPQDHRHFGGSSVLFLNTIRRSIYRRGIVLLPPLWGKVGMGGRGISARISCKS